MNVKYFAWVRERIGVDEETIEVPPSITTVAQLMDHLSSLDDRYKAVFEDRDAIRVALDQMHVEPETELAGAREAAFFPPMTGG